MRNIGLFGIVECVRSPEQYEPLAPHNGLSDEMKAIGTYLREHGLYTFVRWNTIMTNPPLTITEDKLAEGFAIIDGALVEADRAKDQLGDLRIDRGAPGRAMRPRPLSRDE